MQTDNTRQRVILVVEDDPDVLDMVELSLVGCGYRVIVAHDGHEAIAVYR